MSLLKHRCTIDRPTVANVDGEIVHTWAELATGVRCLVQESPGRVRQTAAGQYLFYDAIGFFRPTQDLRPGLTKDAGDRITLTSPSRMSGATFLVNHVADESGMENHLTAFLSRVPSGSGSGAAAGTASGSGS